MDNKETKQLNDTFSLVEKNKLGRAIRAARSFVDAHPHMVYDGELERIEGDFRLMLDYMKRGFNDPQRADVYNNIGDRLYRFACDMRMAYHIKLPHSSLRKCLKKRQA